jgi:hypothetical protein
VPASKWRRSPRGPVGAPASCDLSFDLVVVRPRGCLGSFGGGAGRRRSRGLGYSGTSAEGPVARVCQCHAGSNVLGRLDL